MTILVLNPCYELNKAMKLQKIMLIMHIINNNPKITECIVW